MYAVSIIVALILVILVHRSLIGQNFQRRISSGTKAVAIESIILIVNLCPSFENKSMGAASWIGIQS